MAEQLKPWPGDAVMIVAANAGEEIRENMEGIHLAVCRECGQNLHADTFSVRIAESLPSRFDRPVKFFCVRCALTYDHASIQELHDHRRPRGRSCQP